MSVEVCTIQLPGRENRIQDRPYRRLEALTEAIGNYISPHLGKPFAFFGHSMGAKLCFELARYLRKKYHLEPAHLFVSGSCAPQLSPTEQPSYNLPETEFLEKLRTLNGTPREVFEYPELLEFVIPLLRADFEIVQTYDYKTETPLNCPITAYGGLQDEISREALEAWSEQTSYNFRLRMFPGDHFFIKTYETLLLNTLAKELLQLV
jgi:surfactin synthase thioesterase subunit